MAQVTSPIILDSTGQQIHSDLQQIKNVLTTPSAAADITYDNTGTGMQADDVQDAITELKSNLTELPYYQDGETFSITESVYLIGMSGSNSKSYTATIFLPKKIKSGYTITHSTSLLYRHILC